MNEKEREKIIVRTSVIGILTNVMLVAFKMVVGIISNSIAIILDAVNNLSDALSSVITIVGAKLAGKSPDKKHPLGYGRIEYLSSMIVAALVLYAGITSLVESIKKIIHPEKAEYSIVMIDNRGCGNRKTDSRSLRKKAWAQSQFRCAGCIRV